MLRLSVNCCYDYETCELKLFYKNNVIVVDPGVVEGTDFMNDKNMLDYLHSYILDDDKVMWVELEECDG